MRGLRGFAAGVLTLVALQVLGTGQGPERGGQLVAWLGGGVRRLMAPDVPGIPRPGLKGVGKAVAGAAGDAAKEGAKAVQGTGGSLPRNPTITT